MDVDNQHGAFHLTTHDGMTVVDNADAATHLVYNWVLPELKVRQLTVYRNLDDPSQGGAATPCTLEELYEALRSAVGALGAATATLKVRVRVRAIGRSVRWTSSV